MPHKFTLRQLEYFVAVATRGQISIAAGQCNVTQSAMTVAVAHLEEALGARLFHRVRGGVVLTHEGEIFLHRAKSVLEVANETSRFPFHENTGVTGDLVIGTTYMVLGYFLLRWIDSFRKLFPNVNVIPMEFTRQQVEKKLSNGTLTIAAVILSNLEAPNEVRTLSLTRSPRKAWVSHDHPLVGRESVSLNDVAQYAYVIPRVDDGEMNAEIRWRKSRRKPEKWLYASSLEAVREMVAVGLGVTILPDVLFHPWSLDGRRIHTVPVSNPIPEIDIGIAWHQDSTLTPAALAFKEFLAQSLGSAGRI